MPIFTGLRDTLDTLGVRGLFAVGSRKVFGWPKQLKVKVPTAPFPVHLRLRTSDVSVFRTALRDSEYDLGLSINPNVIIDAGANIGMASIFYAVKYPNARIIAIEPEESNFALLVKNTCSYRNITAIRAALWNCDGEISIGLPAPDSYEKWGFQTGIPGNGKARAVTMQTLLDEIGVETVDLLKMDIEGAEKEVFQSCNWMHRVKVLVIELHDRFKPGCRDAVESAAANWRKTERGEMTVLFSPTLV
jgi:FkbM family methyltransferase